RIAVVVGDACLGVLPEPGRRRVNREVIHPLLRVGGPVAARIGFLRRGLARARLPRSLIAGVMLVVVRCAAAEAIRLPEVRAGRKRLKCGLLQTEGAVVVAVLSESRGGTEGPQVVG